MKNMPVSTKAKVGLIVGGVGAFVILVFLIMNRNATSDKGASGGLNMLPMEASVQADNFTKLTQSAWYHKLTSE